MALTVLYEPVLLSLRRLAQAEESSRRRYRTKARTDTERPPAVAEGLSLVPPTGFEPALPP